MATRTTSKIVTFGKPFALADLEEVLPAGDYVVDTEEDLMDGLSFSAYFRVSTTIYLPSATANASLWRTMRVDPEELDKALSLDRAAMRPPALNGAHEAPIGAIQRPSVDRLAIERAENEGMTAHVC